jgi:hypothetical protein
MNSLFGNLLRFTLRTRSLFKAPASRTVRPVERRTVLSRIGIETLEDRVVPANFHPQFIINDHGTLTTNVGTHTDLTGDIAGYEPAQLRTAYGINNILFNGVQGTGAGQTIAIVDTYNDPNIFSDADMFDQQFGASSDSSQTLYQQFGPTSSFLKEFNQAGQQINPSHTSVPIDPTGGWEFEESLDVEYAHAIAPAATIDLVVANSPTYQALFTAVKSAGKLPGVSVVSMSFGGGEFSQQTSFDGDFTTPAGHQGVTFVASTGDDSSGGYPAFSPNVIAVGGTTLNLNADNTIQSETAWSTLSDYSYSPVSGTGGGASTVEPEPDYQLGVQQTGFRTAPDVAFDADPSTGVAVFDTFRTAVPWNEVGGTSLGAPAIAGLMAIVNQGRTLNGQGTFNASNPQQALSALYSVPSGDFHDITSGTIYTGFFFGVFTGPVYSAGPGYDEVSGLGTPVGNSLANDLAAYTGASTQLSSATTSLTVASSATQTDSFTLSGVKYTAANASFGQTVTLTATVTGGIASVNAPTGEVAFDAVPLFGGNDVVLGTVNLARDGSGQATLTTSSLPVGDYYLTAFYSGDSNYTTSNNYSSSPNLADEVFISQNVTALTLAPSARSVTAGQSVTFTATVAGIGAPTGAGMPTGYVAFYNGKTLLGTAPLPKDGSGQVSFTTSTLPAGKVAVTAVYSGDVNFHSSKTVVTESIAKGSTKVTMKSAINAASSAQMASFTSVVVADLPGSLALTGTVSFYDGKTLLKTITLPADGSGQVTITLPARLAGDSITVVYSGDHNHLGSHATLSQASQAEDAMTGDAGAPE